VVRTVAANATVAFRGNRYSVSPGLAGTQLTLRHRLGTGTVQITSPAGGLLATHQLAPAGAGRIVRTVEHQAALERVVLAAFTTARPCNPKDRRPPGPDALAEAARLLGVDGREVTVDLDAYQQVVAAR
jgi:hypothetical protein